MAPAPLRESAVAMLVHVSGNDVAGVLYSGAKRTAKRAFSGAVGNELHRAMQAGNLALHATVKVEVMIYLHERQRLKVSAHLDLLHGMERENASVSCIESGSPLPTATGASAFGLPLCSGRAL